MKRLSWIAPIIMAVVIVFQMGLIKKQANLNTDLLEFAEELVEKEVIRVRRDTERYQIDVSDQGWYTPGARPEGNSDEITINELPPEMECFWPMEEPKWNDWNRSFVWEGIGEAIDGSPNWRLMPDGTRLFWDECAQCTVRVFSPKDIS